MAVNVGGNAPNIDIEGITKRLDVMRGQLRKVFTFTGTRSIQQLKAFIILGEARHGIHFLPQSTHNYVTSRTMILLNSSDEIEQRFRLQHVNGRDHLFATENLISDHEIINQILLKLEYPRDYIPEAIRATLEDEHNPYNSITEDPPEVRHWCIAGVPREIADIITNELFRLTGRSNWTDVEELFENADRLQQLRTRKRGLQQGHAGRSPLLNLPEEGPANLVGTFATGARGTMGRRTRGPHNLHIAGQEAVLIARLTPILPEVRDLRIPYANRADYEATAQASLASYIRLLAEIEAMRRRRRNRKTRKNRR